MLTHLLPLMALSLLTFTIASQLPLSAQPHQNKLEITANTTLSCGSVTQPLISGYIHLNDGKMFFLFFPASKTETKGLVVHHNGGPGASSMDYPFIGAGPCQLNEEGGLEPAPHPWTDVSNLLVLDYPIGVGWSEVTREDSTPDSAEGAAEEFDDVLQVFLREFPRFIDESLVLSSLSYGGTYVPHTASTILKRNLLAPEGRIIKEVGHILLTNPCGDALTDVRWRYNATCIEQPPVFPKSVCETMQAPLPECEEALEYAYLNSTRSSRLEARKLCFYEDSVRFEQAVRSRFDRRDERCFPPYTCMWWMEPLTKLMHSTEMRTTLGLPDSAKWTFMGDVIARFAANADNMQGAYKLLGPVLDAGTHLVVMSGIQDTMCPWQSTLAWMSKLPSKHLETFRQAPMDSLESWEGWPEGYHKGDTTNVDLFLIEDSGHVLLMKQPELFQRTVGRLLL